MFSHYPLGGKVKYHLACRKCVFSWFLFNLMTSGHLLLGKIVHVYRWAVQVITYVDSANTQQSLFCHTLCCGTQAEDMSEHS